MPNEIFLVNSSSFQNVEISASLRTGPGVVVDFAPASIVTGSFGGDGKRLTNISASYIVLEANTTASHAITASWSPQQQNISVNSITASYISASNIFTVYPTVPQQVATKAYVDAMSVFGFHYYFRSSSADISGYNNMYRLDVPFTSSTTYTIANVSASQYLWSFISPPLSASRITYGDIQTHYHGYYNAGGNRWVTIQEEIYLRSGSVERLITSSHGIALSGEEVPYIDISPLSASIDTDPINDRLVVKIKALSVGGSPDVIFIIDGTTGAGVILPLAPTNFVLKSGDTMTGNLTVPQVIGTASFALTASVALNALPTVSASWASSSLSSSYLNSGANIYLSQSWIEVATGSSQPTWKPGRLFWDSVNHTYAMFNDNPDVTLQVGQERWVHVIAGEAINNADAVYIKGSIQDPDNPTNYMPVIYKALADISIVSIGDRVIGLATHTFTSGSAGWVTATGIVHDVDTSIFLPGDILYLSPTISGYYQNSSPGQPYTSIEIGTVIRDDISGSILVNVTRNPVPANAYAGMTSYPTITDDTASYRIYVSNGTVNLYNNSTGIGAITQYPLLPATFSLTSGSNASFLYTTTNGVTASYKLTQNSSIINGTSVALVATVYRADIDTHIMELDNPGLALANKLQNRLIDTDKFSRVDGFSLYETGSRQFIVTAGTAWYGATRLSASLFNSRNTQSLSLTSNYDEVHFAHHSASQWTIPVVSDGTYNNKYYDDGTDLIALSPLSYSVNYMYRILGDNQLDDDVFYLTGNHEYSSITAAQLDVLPQEIPGVLADVAILVGRIIAQSGSSTAALIESAFTTNFGQSAASQHNSLLGLQGGSGGEYYHLTGNEYTGTGNGVFVKQSGPTINNAVITGSLYGTSSWATNSTNAGTTLITSSTYPITASWSVSSSWAPDIEPISVPSASWVSSSVFITTSQTASYVSASNVNGNVSSASYSLSASNSISSSYSPMRFTGTNFNVPVYVSNNLSTTSSFYGNSTQAAIGSASFDLIDPEVLVVWGNNSVDPNSVAAFYHTTNSFTQVIIQNRSGSNSASADLIMQSDVPAAQQVGYLDLGINNRGYAEDFFNVNGPLDGYLYCAASGSTGGNLAIGCDTAGKQIQFVVGGLRLSNQIMQISDVRNHVQITGSLHVTSGITGSLYGTSSYAQTSSYLIDDYQYKIISSSNYTNVGTLTAIATPLSFSISPGETWIGEAQITAQSSNNRGLRWAISSSAGTMGDIEGMVFSNTTALTAFASARILAINSIVATTVHGQGNTPGLSKINFIVINPSTTTTISIAMAMLNAGDTGTAFIGSYLSARRVR